MALYDNYQGQDQVRPVQDANGVFQRTNTSLEVSDGQTPAQKWLVDNRLPVSFVYGFAAGVNQMVLGKGLVVAVDPLRYQKDFETQKMHSVLTVANGGVNAVFNTTTKVWEALTAGAETTYNAKDDAGKIADTATRVSNKPIGVLFSNIMKKIDDQFNGMTPTVITSKYIKLPLFSDGSHALLNPWGSAYGAIKPGDAVKSDINGRFVKWIEGTDKIEQQVGQVLAIAKDLVPEGAAVWATWALGDRENSDYFNPTEKVPTSNTQYPGYPYDKSNGYNELNKANPRLPLDLDIKRGIPGLTDGGRVASTVVSNQLMDEVPLGLASYTQPRYCRTLENGSTITNLTFAVKTTLIDGVTTHVGAPVALAAGAVLMLDDGTAQTQLAHIDFADPLSGLGVVVIDNGALLDKTKIKSVEIVASYKKAGLAGVPTMLDWDGVVGEIRILIK